ncbi:hypothetical protein, partial [Accumulibacter sp.]|uniref:hypothetical protein n=1 Tax=Accumulibacter sp. TaxID=2053492 RepID=UPI00257FEFF4
GICTSVAESQPLAGACPLHRQQDSRGETEESEAARLAAAFARLWKRLTEEFRMNILLFTARTTLLRA